MKKQFAIVLVSCLAAFFIVLALVLVHFESGGTRAMNAEQRSAGIRNMLTKAELDALRVFGEQYQNFPAPSDKLVRSVADILLRHRCSRTDVQELLGAPTRVSTRKQGELTTETWGYDIADSRAIAVYFDAQGVTRIQGAGVGFDWLDTPVLGGAQ